MVLDLIIAILWSLSPLGEAKVGIPYGLLRGLNSYLVLVVCFLANAMVFPLMLFFLEYVNRYLLRWNLYKKMAIWVAKRAKLGSGAKIRKYGFWGLMFFVMIPLPGTGVYAGSIATYLLKMERSKAFMANTIGIFFSSLFIWLATIASMKVH